MNIILMQFRAERKHTFRHKLHKFIYVLHCTVFWQISLFLHKINLTTAGKAIPSKQRVERRAVLTARLLLEAVLVALSGLLLKDVIGTYQHRRRRCRRRRRAFLVSTP